MGNPTSAPITPIRRTLATRDARWAARLAHQLACLGVQPNAVSLTSVAVALVASLAFTAVPTATPRARTAVLLGAAAAIQLRLLCNLLDGMLAVEERLATATGEIYNELPDRVADVVIFVGAGHAVQVFPYGQALGWATAVCALGTAYVRALGGSLGVAQSFAGPMAKQHRMATLTAVTTIAAGEAWLGRPPLVLLVGLITILVGSLITIGRRVKLLAREMATR